MVSLTVSNPREDGLLTTSSLVRTILIAEHDPSQAGSFTRHLSFKPHHHAKRVTSAAAA
jgi:hypothetical protein